MSSTIIDGAEGCVADVAALADAAAVYQKLTWNAVSVGEPAPAPGALSADDPARGRRARVQATPPAVAAL